MHLSFQLSLSCALPNIKVLKDKDLEFANSISEVNETLCAASVPMKKEADTRVLPAHVENGGDTSGTRWLPHGPLCPIRPPGAVLNSSLNYSVTACNPKGAGLPAAAIGAHIQCGPDYGDRDKSCGPEHAVLAVPADFDCRPFPRVIAPS